MSKGKLIVFSAPSGAGKTTIVRSILREYPDLVFSVSATTRKRRDTEVDGKDYVFITEDDFKNRIDMKEFLEWEKFYDYYYGTLKDKTEELLEDGKLVVLELDVKGALSVKNAYPDSVLIYILPPSIEVLKERLIKRNTESKEDLQKRFERIDLELGFKEQFDYQIVNDDLESAKNIVKEIIEKIINGVNYASKAN